MSHFSLIQSARAFLEHPAILCMSLFLKQRNLRGLTTLPKLAVGNGTLFLQVTGVTGFRVTCPHTYPMTQTPSVAQSASEPTLVPVSLCRRHSSVFASMKSGAERYSLLLSPSLFSFFLFLRKFHVEKTS